MKKNQLPSVSFVTCTFNSDKILEECLSSIDKLDYPKNLIEKIIVDGGSKDKTLLIAKKHKCKIIKEKTGRPEAATAIGYNVVKTELIVNFPSDNVILYKKWLKDMVAPLILHDDILAVETLRYSYVKKDKSLNRYFALFGASDPVAYYLNKRDRITYFEEKWPLEAKAKDYGSYYIAEFNERNTPPLGANGFIVRTKIIQKVTDNPLKFFHTDSTLDLIKQGYTKFAFVKNSIWHKTGVDLATFFKHKIRYANIYFKDQSLRRYHLFDFKYDKVKLLRYILLSLTIVYPFVESVKGYKKIRDKAWFYHPIFCFIFVFLYGYTFIINKINIVYKDEK